MDKIYGWTGKILKVNLSTGKITYIDTMRYVPKFIGGLGVGAAIAWEEIGPNVGPFDPENLLIIMTGPLTGTLASGAGRVEVMGVAPQLRPPRFSRSGMGGYWGPELKYAGFDGIVIEGKSTKPVYLWIKDGLAEILGADEIWGKGVYETQKILRNIHGRETRVVAIGPAGENLSRIAALITETDNAAGQGGFGAVMGSKKLKAIAVRGTGGVKVAKPREFLELCLTQSREGIGPSKPGSNPKWPTTKQLYGKYPIEGAEFRAHKCGFCSSTCTSTINMNVPGEVTGKRYTIECLCYSYEPLNLQGRIESRYLTSDYGINGWEVAYGIIPWLQLCKQHGLISEIDGIEIPSPEKPIEYLIDCRYSAKFVVTLLNKIAFREGLLGDALADGACYAADKLFNGKGKPLLDRIYPRHCGMTEHWTGHWGPGGEIHFPWWLVPLLQWCVDTRDPASDTSHSWTSHVCRYLTENGPYSGPYPLEKVRAVSKKVYGDPNVLDPAFKYDPPETKAIPAIWHTDRGMIVDSLIVCDYEHPRVFSSFSEDGSADTSLLAKLFSTCTGIAVSEEELQRSGERIFNLLRAIDIRNYGRNREEDEKTIEVLMYPGEHDGVVLDKAKFLKLMDKYYELRGWNKANGWPTRAKLEALDLKDVADELESLGKLG